MATLQELKVTERDTTLTPRQLRAAGYVPATLYGAGQESRSAQVRMHEFNVAFVQGVREFKLTGLVEETAVAHQVQRDPVSQQPISIQFLLAGEAGARKTKSSKTVQAQPKSKKQEVALSGV